MPTSPCVSPRGSRAPRAPHYSPCEAPPALSEAYKASSLQRTSMSLSFADLLRLPPPDDDDEENDDNEIETDCKRVVSTSAAGAGVDSEDATLCRKMSRTMIMRGLTFLLLGVVLLMSGVALGLTAAAVLGTNDDATVLVQAGLVRRAPYDITLTPYTDAASKGAAALARGGQVAMGDDGTALRNPLEVINHAQAAHLDDDNVQPDGPDHDRLKRLGRRRDGPAGGARLPRGSQQQRSGNGAAAGIGRLGARGRAGRGGKQQQP